MGMMLFTLDVVIVAAVIPVLIVLIIFMILLRGAPFVMLKAKLSKRPLLFIIRPDRTMKIALGEYISGTGIVKANPIGYFIVNDASTYLVHGAKSVGMICYEYYGVALPREAIMFAQKAKESGVETIDDAERKDVEIQVAGETLRVHDVVGFFKYFANPARLASLVTHVRQAVLAEKGPNLASLAKWGLFIFFLAVAIAVVWSVITGMSPAGVANTVRQVGNMTVPGVVKP